MLNMDYYIVIYIHIVLYKCNKKKHEYLGREGTVGRRRRGKTQSQVNRKRVQWPAIFHSIKNNKYCTQ